MHLVCEKREREREREREKERGRNLSLCTYYLELPKPQDKTSDAPSIRNNVLKGLLL